MAEPVIAPLPMMELGPGYKIQLNAVDPTSGSSVGGVTVSAIAITGEFTDGAGSGASGPFTLVDPKLLHKA